MVSFYHPEVISEYLWLPRQQPRAPALSAAPRSPSVVSWLHSLPFYTLTQVFCAVCPQVTKLLIQMHFRQIRQGACVVVLGAPGEFDSFKLRTDSRGQGTDFEQIVRLTDTFEYLDTLCVERFLLMELGRVLALMKGVSNGKALTEPCAQRRDPHTGEVRRQLPKWARNTELTLGQLSCAALEQAVWEKFFAYTENSCSGYMLDHAGVSDRKIADGLGKLQGLKDSFSGVKQYLSAFVGETLTSYSHNEFSDTNGNYISSRSKYVFYQCSHSVKLFLENKSTMSSLKFCCFLAYTPLNRAMTVFDVLARQLLFKLLNFQTKRPPLLESTSSTTTSSKEEVDELGIQSFPLSNKPLAKKHEARKKRRNLKKGPKFPLKSWKKKKNSPNPPLDFTEFPALVPTKSALHSEIEQHVDLAKSQLSIKRNFVYQALDQLQYIINRWLPQSRVLLFGSYATGLCLDSSDVDLQVSSPHCKTRESIQYVCTGLAEHFALYPWICGACCIPSASIPVVKLQVQMLHFSGADSLLSIDITFDDSVVGKVSSHLGLLSLSLTRELLGNYPSLESTVLVLKQLLHVNGLNSSYTGGLSSYSLLVWVVAYLNSLCAPPEDLGELLTGFLGYYGKEFDRRSTTIDIANKGSFTQTKGLESVLTVDPVRSSLNTTRTAFCVDKILELFKTTHHQLTKRKGKAQLTDVLLGSFRS